jgi:hypothetical protein
MYSEEELTQSIIYPVPPSLRSVSGVSVSRRKTAPGPKFYTPQFSEMATVSIRRLAWAMGEKVKMTAAVNLIISLLPQVFPAASICSHCQDKSKCQMCIFSQDISEQEKIPVYL